MPRKRKEQDASAATREPVRITPLDIQQKEFRLSFRGYNMREVDVFLDAVTEEVARLYAENKGLREEPQVAPGGRTDSGAQHEAEAILRQAREDATRIIAEAEAEARAMALATGPSGGPEPAGRSRAQVGQFLSKEKEFLQRLAALIQEHAQDVKATASRVRDESATRAAFPSERPESPGRDAMSAAAGPPERRTAQTQEMAELGADSDPGESNGRQSPREREERVAAESGGLESEDADEPFEGSPAAGQDENPPSALRLTAATGGDSTSAARAKPPSSTHERRESDDAGEDRSIRELFWGED